MKFKIKKTLACMPMLFIGCVLPQITRAQQVLTLERCRQMALERNNNIKAAVEDINAARAQKAQQDVGGRPSVDGSITGFYFGKPLNAIIPEYGVSSGLGITQPIYAGGKARLGKEIAANGVEIRQEQKALVTTEVLFTTERAYWLVVSALERIKLALQTKKQLDALYTDLNNHFTAGTTYKNDVLQAQVQQNANELDISRAEDNLTMAKLYLAQVTGLTDSTSFTVADFLEAPLDIVINNSPMQQAPTNRSEIKILQTSVSTAELQQKMLAADLRPGVSLALNGITAFGKSGINPTNKDNFMASYYSMLSINIPVFDWGRKRKKIQEQQFKVSSQRYQLKEREEQVTLEVQQAFLQLGQSVKRIGLSALSLSQAEENLKLSNDRFKAGTIVGKDVLEALTIWQQAKSNLLEAKVQYKIDAAAYQKATGSIER